MEGATQLATYCAMCKGLSGDWAPEV